MSQKQKGKKFPKFKRCSCRTLHQAGFQIENFSSLPDWPTAPFNNENKSFWNPVSARNSFDGIETGKENKAFEAFDKETESAAL